MCCAVWALVAVDFLACVKRKLVKGGEFTNADLSIEENEGIKRKENIPESPL
jgi:hypothetical protein